MKKDRKELYPLLTSILRSNINNKNIANVVINYMRSKKISLGKIISILNTNTPIQLISDTEFILLVIGFYKATGDSRLNPSELFHANDINQAESYTEPVQTVNNKIVIPNIDQVAPNVWVCNTVPRINVAKWFNWGLLTYNPATQRPTKKIPYGKEIIEMADINPQSVHSIYEACINGLFFHNTVTFNVRRTGFERPPQYNAKTRTLTIYVDNETTFLDMPDGVHRIGGFVKVLYKEPHHEGLTGLRILYCEEKDVHRFIKQEATHNDIPEETLSYYDTGNKFMELTKSIDSETGLNEMFRKFAKDRIETEHGNKFVTFNSFALAIEEFFRFKDSREGRLVKEFIIEGLNEIIGIFRKEFQDTNMSKQNNIITENNTFVGYLFILSQLFDQDMFKGIPQWQNKLEEILNTIDFGIDSNDWESIGIYNQKVNRSVIHKIVTFFIDFTLDRLTIK